jgi:CDP-diacylglycerol--glycerol-3-phosphate 3-phosphatidyltransferase
MQGSENSGIISKNNLSSLRKKWMGILFLHALLLAVCYFLLDSQWESQSVYRWMGLAVFFSLFYFWFLWQRLELNHSPSSTEILPNFGPGNLLTILRGMLLMLLAGFLLSQRPQGWLAFLPGLLYALAALMDLFDGYFARVSNHQTKLGEELDLSLDGLGILVAGLLLVQYGQVPYWYLLVGLARYLFVGGIWLRDRLGKPVYPLTENFSRRPFAGAQMGFAAVALFPVFTPPGTFLAAAFFALPFLVGFLLDWFSVSGFTRRPRIKENYLLARCSAFLDSAQFEGMKHALYKWIPLIIRTTLIVLLIIWLSINFLGVFESLNNPALNQHLPGRMPAFWSGSLLLLMVGGLALITVGIAGRVAALLVLIGLGMYLEIFHLGLIEFLLVLSAFGLFYLGTGPFSLWNPERKIISQRLGES